MSNFPRNIGQNILNIILLDLQIIFPFNATCLVTLYDLSTGGSRRLRNNLTTTLVVREVPRVNPSNHDRGVYRRGEYFTTQLSYFTII